MKTIAIAGNPNSGKSCIFNNLTGSRQRVGNYAGVTVEFTEGTCQINDEKVKIIDLPGTYSLTAYSQEEVVSRDFIVKEKPDALMIVVDASNLERNLYFTIQLIELGVPVVIALNMVDVAEKKGFTIDTVLLSKLLGVEVVPTVAFKKEGMEELKRACLKVTKSRITPKDLTYSHELEGSLEPIIEELEKHPEFTKEYPTDWVAVKLFEEDKEVLEKLAAYENKAAIETSIELGKKFLKKHSDESPKTAVAEARYAIANGINKEVTKRNELGQRILTGKIDSFVCHRFLGWAILVGVIYALFWLSFQISGEWNWIPPIIGDEWVSPMGFVELIFENIATWASEASWMGDTMKSLFVDGIIGGVGGVLGFAPLIFFIFLFISALEDSGYIARIAFILDRVLRVFGLQGKSILALIVSGGVAGGCAVPGIMATRTLREEKDRLVTIMVAPMMNCGAKMPVYAMLIAAFFAKHEAGMMVLLMVLSWGFALISALILRKFVIKGEQTPFVMELPIYHVPTIRGVLHHTWGRTWSYIKKAGTLLLAISIVMWALMTYPKTEVDPTLDENAASQVELRNTVAGKIGTTIEPVTQIAGFDWRDNIALIGGLAAKEVVVGTLGVAYSMGDVDPEESETLATRVQEEWSKPDADGKNRGPLKAFAMIIFVMLYAPCVATLAVIKKETGSWKWTLFSTGYSTALGFVVAVLIYQIGAFLI